MQHASQLTLESGWNIFILRKMKIIRKSVIYDNILKTTIIIILQYAAINIPTTPKPDEKYELSAENLDLMWTEFAIEILSENGIQVIIALNIN